MNASEFAERLHATKTTAGWQARCLAHEDDTASLSIAEGKAGQVLIHCHAGCTPEAVVAAMGLKWADLFPDKPKRNGEKRRFVETYPYTDETGDLLFEVVRYAPKDFLQRRPDGRGGWLWKLGDTRRVLFRLRDVLLAKADGHPILLAEGEKDVLALVEHGFCSSCNSGGAESKPDGTKWLASYNETLRRADVAIVADKDGPGRRHAQIVAGHLYPVAHSVRVLELPDVADKPVKDAADFFAAGGTALQLGELVSSTPAWTPPAAPVASDSEHHAAGDPVESARAGNPYALSDLGNAERLVFYHGENLCWDTARKAWRKWDGARWAIDSCLDVQRRAADSARKIRLEAAAVPASGGSRDDPAKRLFSWALSSESRDKMAAAIEVSKSRPGIAVEANAFDADPWKLNVLNGVIDLKTGELLPHDKSARMTKLVSVEYLPGHQDERWLKFLHDVTGADEDQQSFLQLAAGYTLTGDVSEENLFLVYGPTAGGKSTFLEALRAALGDYSRAIQPDLLVKQRNPRSGGNASPELAALAGARLAVGSEMEQGREIAEALVKNLTGGEAITARHLFAELFDYHPQFKLWLALNHCPRVSADDDAIWRRILRIGFDYTIPPERRDKTLKPYLRDPTGGAPAVLAWAVEGCLRWQREGLAIPDKVSKSTSAYRQESDPLALFLEDCLAFTESTWAPWYDIWAAYQAHSNELGTDQRFRVAPRRLQEKLRARGCVSDKRHEGRGWINVSIRSAWQGRNP